MNPVLGALLFFLPAGAANLMPPLIARIPMLAGWTTPLDFGQTFRGKRIFGSNKTWRGLIGGVICALITAFLIYRSYPTDNSLAHTLFQGGLMGAGALIGDAVESFLKRQRGIGPGTSWFPFDQTDYIVGGLLFALPLGLPSTDYIPIIFGLFFGLHIGFGYLGYLLGIKNKPL